MEALSENILNGLIEASVVVGSRGTRERINKQRPRTKTFTILQSDVTNLILRQGLCCAVSGVPLWRMNGFKFLGPVGCVNDGIERVSSVTIRGGGVRIVLSLFAGKGWSAEVVDAIRREVYMWEPSFSRMDVVRDVRSPYGWIPTYLTSRGPVYDKSDKSGPVVRGTKPGDLFMMSYDNFIDKVNNQMRLCHISGTRLTLRDPSKYTILRLRNGEYLTPDNCVIVNSLFARRWSPRLFTFVFRRVSGVVRIQCLKVIYGSTPQFIFPVRCDVRDNNRDTWSHMAGTMKGIAVGEITTRIRPRDRQLV